MIPSLIEIKILVKRPIFITLGNKGLKGSPWFLNNELNIRIIIVSLLFPIL